MSEESQLPSEVLEQRAAEQRHRLHNSVADLRESVRENVRERLDVRRYLRQYMWPVTMGCSVVGLLLGYQFAGMFTRR